MRKWQTRREIVSPPLTMHIVFRIVDGVEERSGTHYATLDEALTHVRELNAKEKRPQRRQPLRAQGNKAIS